MLAVRRIARTTMIELCILVICIFNVLVFDASVMRNVIYIRSFADACLVFIEKVCVVFFAQVKESIKAVWHTLFGSSFYSKESLQSMRHGWAVGIDIAQLQRNRMGRGVYYGVVQARKAPPAAMLAVTINHGSIFEIVL